MEPQLEPGRRIGRYEILSYIGRGGMSTVYRARLLGPAQASKQVALKLIHSHLIQRHSFVLMFLDEMRLAMSLEHRNVVQTFDAGRIESDYYMVMELVDGCSLRELLNLQPGTALPLDIAIFIAMEVCSALDYAHTLGREGVVHRDVSPGNVLLSGQGDVKLTDFGIAKAAGRLSQTQAKALKGKLEYMAPEQARGEVVPRSDLFSLGAVLYETIGNRPLRQQPSLDEVRAYDGVTIPPSGLRPGIPPPLEAAVQRCLAPSPGDRPDAAEMRRLLREVHGDLLREEGPEPHARLKEYLSAVLGARRRGAEDAAKLASAMIAQVKELPTDPAIDLDRPDPPASGSSRADPPSTAVLVEAQVSEEPGARRSHPGERTAVLQDRPDDDLSSGERDARARTTGLLVAAAVVLLSALIVFSILWVTRGPGPPSSVAVTDARTGAVDLARPVAVQPDAAPTAGPSPKLDQGQRAAPTRARRPRGRGRQKGQLTLNTEPWTSVFIDGKYFGETPIQRLPLKPGFHRIKLVNTKEGISRVVRLRIRARQHVRKVLVLR